MRGFAHYFEGKPSGLNPPAIIRNNPYFQGLREQVTTTIMEDYVAAREYVQVRNGGPSFAAATKKQVLGGKGGVSWSLAAPSTLDPDRPTCRPPP